MTVECSVRWTKTPNISLLDFKRGLKTMLFKQASA